MMTSIQAVVNSVRQVIIGAKNLVAKKEQRENEAIIARLYVQNIVFFFCLFFFVFFMMIIVHSFPLSSILKHVLFFLFFLSSSFSFLFFSCLIFYYYYYFSDGGDVRLSRLDPLEMGGRSSFDSTISESSEDSHRMGIFRSESQSSLGSVQGKADEDSDDDDAPVKKKPSNKLANFFGEAPPSNKKLSKFFGANPAMKEAPKAKTVRKP
jgi:hypothetical protein